MSKDKLQLLSPLFLKYQADFEKNSRSRVFAPLAETYRKLGMNEKAMEILAQGIRFNPTYLMGYLGMAFCYYDLRQFNLAYSTIRPLVEANRDNIRLQKLFADVCLELGKKEEALETLKYLLFINPRDQNVAVLVQRVEEEVENKYRPNHKPIIIPAEDLTGERLHSTESSIFNLEKLNNPIKLDSNDFDDWMTVDLNPETKNEIDYPAKNYDHWNVKKITETHLAEEKAETKSFHVHLDLEKDSEVSGLKIQEAFNEEAEVEIEDEIYNETPLVTHTLVDLYCGQGHIEKALEVLEKILLLNPKDTKTINKIKEIQALVQPLENYDEIVQVTAPKSKMEAKNVSEEDGRRHLMSLIDENWAPIEIAEDDTKKENARLVEGKLSLFLKKIQKRALDYQARV